MWPKQLVIWGTFAVNKRNGGKFFMGVLILKLSFKKVATSKIVVKASFLLKTRSHLIVFRWDKETSLLSLFTLAPEIKDFFLS